MIFEHFGTETHEFFSISMGLCIGLGRLVSSDKEQTKAKALQGGGPSRSKQFSMQEEQLEQRQTASLPFISLFF